MSMNTHGPANRGLTMLGSSFVGALRSVEAAAAGGVGGSCFDNQSNMVAMGVWYTFFFVEGAAPCVQSNGHVDAPERSAHCADPNLIFWTISTTSASSIKAHGETHDADKFHSFCI